MGDLKNANVKRAAVEISIGLVVSFLLALTPFGRYMWIARVTKLWNEADETRNLTKEVVVRTVSVDAATLKAVEDTCRVLVVSYMADKLTYEQYKNADTEEKRSWGEAAKMRANKTAAMYNEYILKNSYVWNGVVPGDISGELDYLN